MHLHATGECRIESVPAASAHVPRSVLASGIISSLKAQAVEWAVCHSQVLRRFRIDTEVRCVGAHPPFWPFEPARVKPN